MNTVIDLKPLLDHVIWPLAAALIPVLATWLSIKAAKLLGLKSDNEIRRYIEPALQNALAYGQQVTGDKPITIDAKNAIVAEAANFAIQQVPAGLKQLGLDAAAVSAMLAARLEANVSAQTPEITATAAAPMPTAVSKPAEPVPVLAAVVTEAPAPKEVK